MTHKLYNELLCSIEWEHPDHPGNTVLLDETGDTIHVFYGHWEPDHVWQALHFANETFLKQIRQILELN